MYVCDKWYTEKSTETTRNDKTPCDKIPTTKHQTTQDKKTKELAKNMVKYLLIQMHDKLKFNSFFAFLEIKGNMQKFIKSSFCTCML